MRNQLFALMLSGWAGIAAAATIETESATGLLNGILGFARGLEINPKLITTLVFVQPVGQADELGQRPQAHEGANVRADLEHDQTLTKSTAGVGGQTWPGHPQPQGFTKSGIAAAGYSYCAPFGATNDRWGGGRI